MKGYRTRAEILISALTRELELTTAKAAKAKAEADECQGIAAEMLAIHQAFVAIVDSKATGKKAIADLEALKKRDARARRILNKDFVKLLDAQFLAEADRDRVAQVLDSTKASLSLMGELN